MNLGILSAASYNFLDLGVILIIRDNIHLFETFLLLENYVDCASKYVLSSFLR